MRFKLIIYLFLAIFLIGCTTKISQETEENQKILEVSEMKLTSPAFENNKNMPDRYTCRGQGINPQLEISGVPNNTKSLALIMDDPDAPSGDFVHWILYNIPAKTDSIYENSSEGSHGQNSAGKTSYYAPCPPSGTHRYVFKLYSLDTSFEFKKAPSKSELESSMQGHILAKTELIGLYSK